MTHYPPFENCIMFSRTGAEGLLTSVTAVVSHDCAWQPIASLVETPLNVLDIHIIGLEIRMIGEDKFLTLCRLGSPSA